MILKDITDLNLRAASKAALFNPANRRIPHTPKMSIRIAEI